MALLPSPRTTDTNGAGHHGDSGMDLRTAIAEIPLLPTPVAKEPGGTPDQYRQRLRDHDGRDGAFLPLSMAVQLLPTPMANEAEKAIQGPRLSDGQKYLSNVIHELLPTPRATDGTKGGPNQRGSSGDLMLPSAVNLLPTPSVADIEGGRKSRSGDRSDELLLNGIAAYDRWGEYGPAIRRWEAVTRPAPEPTKLNAKGNPKLSDEFDEWLMGFPAGWITDVPGITWNETLKACGNGVVWQQGAEAVRFVIRMGEAR